MTGHVLPDILIQVSPQLRLFWNGQDVTKELRAQASVAIFRAGKVCGWVAGNFRLGAKEGTTPRGVSAAQPTTRASTTEFFDPGPSKYDREPTDTEE